MENALLRYPICLAFFVIHIYVYGQQVSLQVSLQQQSNNHWIPLSSSSNKVIHQESNFSIHGHNNKNEQLQKYFWVNAGLGGTSMRTSAGSAIISLNYQHNKRLFTGRYVYNAPYLIFSTLYHKMQEVSVLYGISGKGRVGYASIGAGIGLVKDVLYHDGWLSTNGNKQNVYTGPGIPIESQLFLTTRYVGVGLILLANINPHHCYVGYLLSLQAGKLKNKRVRS